MTTSASPNFTHEFPSGCKIADSAVVCGATRSTFWAPTFQSASPNLSCDDCSQPKDCGYWFLNQCSIFQPPRGKLGVPMQHRDILNFATTDYCGQNWEMSESVI